MKLISMFKQSSHDSQTLSDLNEQPLLATHEDTLSDDAKVNMILTKKTCVQRICSDHVIANIIKLIASNMPFGIPVSTLTEAYNTNYNMCPSLDVSQFGVKSIADLMSSMSRKLPIYCQTIKGINRVFADCRYNVTFVDKCDFTQGFIDKNFVDRHFRSKVVYPGEYFVNMSLPLDDNTGITNSYGSVEVRVTYIKDPLNIWIQFIGDNCHAVLNQLLADLKFYNQVDLEKWRIPHHFLCIGLPVITFCPSTKCWQRARIIEIHSFTVTVMFVDIGGTTTPSITNIYVMKRQFLTLPAQAIHVGLYGVKHLVGENFQWPVKLVYELRYTLYIKMSSEPIRCSFTQKLSDDYYYVHLFDQKNISLDLDVFVSDFFTDESFTQNRFPLEWISQTGSTSSSDINKSGDKADPQNYYSGVRMTYLNNKLFKATKNNNSGISLAYLNAMEETENYLRGVNLTYLDTIKAYENLLISKRRRTPAIITDPKTGRNLSHLNSSNKTENLLISIPMPSPATISAKSNANLDQLLLEPISCDEMRKLGAPLIPHKLQSQSAECSANDLSVICDNNVIINEERTASPLCSKSIINLKPSIKIRSHINHKENTIINKNTNLINSSSAESLLPNFVKDNMTNNKKSLQSALPYGMLKHDSPLISSKLEAITGNGSVENTVKSEEIKQEIEKKSVKLRPNIKITFGIGSGKRRVSNVVEFPI